MGPLDFLKNLGKEPNLGDKEKRDDDNKAYKEECYDFKGGQDKLKNDLFGKKQEKQKEVLEGFEDHPSYPIIERFSGACNSELSEEDMVKITEVLNKKNPDTTTDLEALKGVNINKDNNEHFHKYISKIITLNATTDIDANEEVKIPKEFDTIDLLQDKDNAIVQLLARNYIRIPDGEKGEPDVMKDIETTFSITLNKIIEGKNFTRTGGFELAVEDIKNGNIETKFEALSYVYSLINTTEGSKGAKSKTSFEQIKKTHDTKKQEYLDFKVDQLNTQMKGTKNDTERMKLTLEIGRLEDEKNEDDFKGEVFRSGKLDKSSDTNNVLPNL